MPAAEMASELRQRGIEHGGDGTPEVNLRAMLVLADLDAAGPADYSSSCDVGRHALAYGNTSQLDNAVQYLQSLDDAEAAHTQTNRSVFGDDTDRLRIVLLRTKNRIGEPNSSFYSDLMLNLMFADDPTETVHELQLQHTDLATIRNEGSHTYYNKTRSARELLEARGEAARIPAVALEPPQLPAAGGGGGAGGGGVGGASAAAVARLQAELKAVKATGVQQAAELKAVRAELLPLEATVADLTPLKATVAEQADELKSVTAASVEQTKMLKVLEAAVNVMQGLLAQRAHHVDGLSLSTDANTEGVGGNAVMDAASIQHIGHSTTSASTHVEGGEGDHARQEQELAEPCRRRAEGAGHVGTTAADTPLAPSVRPTMLASELVESTQATAAKHPIRSSTVPSRNRMLTGLNGDSARVMRDMFASEGAGADDVQPAPDALPLSNPLRKSVRDRGQTPPLSVTSSGPEGGSLKSSRPSSAWWCRRTVPSPRNTASC